MTRWGARFLVHNREDFMSARYTTCGLTGVRFMSFKYSTCGRDTLTRPHKPNCAVLAQQARKKVEELGIGFNPEQLQLPLKLGGS